MTMNQYIPAKFIKDRREDALIELAIEMGANWWDSERQRETPRPTPDDVRKLLKEKA